MAKLQINTTNFTAGEFTPLLAGRVDLEKYNASAKTLKNVVVLKQGGVTIRPPLTLQTETKDSTKLSRLVPFIYSRTDAYQLEFGESYMRVRKADGDVVESAPSTPYEIATPYLQIDDLFSIDFTQGDDTMILTHPKYFPRRLRRFADDRWVLDVPPFLPQPVAEVGDQGAVTMTISLGTVGTGRTITASGNYFLASDVGREITWGGGVALITAVGGPTSATVTVTSAFADLVGYPSALPFWTLLNSPKTTATASASSPAGAAITITLGAAGFRADAGSLIEINGGLVRLTNITSTTVADAVILRELTSTVVSPSGSWALLGPVWNANRGYPKTCAFYQQRLWFANTTAYPQSEWGSRTGLYFDFTPGTDDDSAVYKTAAATDEVNPLQFLCGSGSLIMLGYGAEVEGKGGIEKPITPSNMQINAQSEWGCENVRPVSVGKEILWVERGGKALRVLFAQQVEGYDSSDVSVFSEHLLVDGIAQISYERRPNSVVWVATTTGALLAFTYNREQNTIAWASGETDGAVESLSTVPYDGAEVTDAIVRRTINGVEKRFIERLSWDVNQGFARGFLDCRVVRYPGSATATGFDVFNGTTVSVIADGVPMGGLPVSGGTITLPRSAIEVVAGLPYEVKVVLPPPEMGTGTGTSTAQAKSTNKIQVRLHKTVGLTVNGQEVDFRRFDTPATLDNPVAPFTGIKDITEYGWDGDEGQDLTLEQPQGLPWTVLAVVRTITTNAG
jgi:hypothetical protein